MALEGCAPPAPGDRVSPLVMDVTDEGSIRDEAESAIGRASQSRVPRRSEEIDPEVVAEIHGVDRLTSCRGVRTAAVTAATDEDQGDEESGEVE